MSDPTKVYVAAVMTPDQFPEYASDGDFGNDLRIGVMKSLRNIFYKTRTVKMKDCPKSLHLVMNPMCRVV